MLKINNYSRSNFLYPRNRVNQCFGDNQENKTSETKDKKEKLAFVALPIALAFAIALKIANAAKTHKTFKDYRKNMSFMDWNNATLLASAGIATGMVAYDELHKKENNAQKKEIFSFRNKIAAGAIVATFVTLAVSLLDIVINVDGLFKKGFRKP